MFLSPYHILLAIYFILSWLIYEVKTMWYQKYRKRDKRRRERICKTIKISWPYLIGQCTRWTKDHILYRTIPLNTLGHQSCWCTTRKKKKKKNSGSKTEFKFSQQSLSYYEFTWHLQSLNKSLNLAIHLNAGDYSEKRAIESENSLFSGLVFSRGYAKRRND